VRCPYCGTQNDEAAEVCRKCSQELPAERGPWRGPTASSRSAAASNVQSAHDEWDPARRFSEPRSMSKFVAPARYPEHLGWAITIIVLGLPATVIHAILFWNQVQYPRHLGWGVAFLMLCCVPLSVIALFFSRTVRRKHAVGDDGRAFRYSRLAMLSCWIALIAGLALYVIIFMRLLQGVGEL
jgi:hypothetical protein